MQKTSQGTIKNSLVSPGCEIFGYVENSVLSPGVRVEEGAIVRDSILMPQVTVGRHSMVDHCILDEDAVIGSYCYLGFDAGTAKSEPVITVVGKGAEVPSHIAIGRNCTIMPHVGAGDFEGNIVRAGTTLAPQKEPAHNNRN
jgi:glucose-1-phosphate adenylyltransferase